MTGLFWVPTSSIALWCARLGDGEAQVETLTASGGAAKDGLAPLLQQRCSVATLDRRVAHHLPPEIVCAARFQWGEHFERRRRHHRALERPVRYPVAPGASKIPSASHYRSGLALHARASFCASVI